MAADLVAIIERDMSGDAAWYVQMDEKGDIFWQDSQQHSPNNPLRTA